MAREVKKLSARSVTTLSKPGRHSDGDGLYLVVDPTGARRWLFLFRWQGKLKEMGLGGVTSVSLSEARDRAGAARKILAGGVNPIEARKASATEAEAVPTFGEFADALVDDIKSGFKNEKHRAQWSSTLKIHAASLRPLRVNEVQTEHVLAVLKPMWKHKQETASRLRGRIERVLDAAKAKGKRAGENPARWRGHLDQLLPRRRKLTRGHHPAMPYDAVPAFVKDLRDRDGLSALALEFTILTASRTSEIIGARWSEIDLKAKVWTIPAERIKAGREHRVPLTERALSILDEVALVKRDDFVFPGQKSSRSKDAPDKPRHMSNMAMAVLLNVRMGQPDFTVHGFRSSFRDWAGEATAFPREIAEAALAHVVGDETERAYRRGDALTKRRKLMEAWAGFVGTPKTDAKVSPLRPVKASWRISSCMGIGRPADKSRAPLDFPMLTMERRRSAA
jgi:integrase